MNRSLLNLIIDLLAALAMLVMVATGYIMRFPLPPQTNRTHELWGMSRHEWGSIHFWASLVLLAVIATHVILHWEWLFAMIRRRFTKLKAQPRQRVIAGIITVIGLALLAGLFAWAAHSGVQEVENTRKHSWREFRGRPAGISDSAALTNEVDFQRDVVPIFKASCIDCHGSRRQRSSLRVDRRKDFFEPRDPTPIIVPGNADKSRLIAIVSGKVNDMKSAEDHILTPEEVAVLKAWINAGAVWQVK